MRVTEPALFSSARGTKTRTAKLLGRCVESHFIVALF